MLSTLQLYKYDTDSYIILVCVSPFTVIWPGAEKGDFVTNYVGQMFYRATSGLQVQVTYTDEGHADCMPRAAAPGDKQYAHDMTKWYKLGNSPVVHRSYTLQCRE